MNDESKPPFAKRHRGLRNSRGGKRELDNEDMSGDDCQDEERPHKYMAITNMEENPYQDDMKWTASEVSDMCTLSFKQDPKHGAADLVGLLQKAMYGTRDAPQIWAKEVQKVMEELGFVISMFQPSVYCHPSKDLIVVVHLDDFLCSGELKELEWLYDNLAQKFELKKSLIMKDSEQEVKYLGRTIRWTYDDNGEGLFEVEGDERHSQLLLQEWTMQQCKDVDTPVTKAGEESINTGDELNENEARRARRAIARMNYMSQDRPDLSVAARMMSQYMSRPREGIVIKRAIRYLKRYPRCCLVVPNNLSENFEIGVWSDNSDWASEQATRRSCSGGYIQVNVVTVGHWSKTQLNVALSSGEAELNASVKALSETVGLKNCSWRRH